MNNTNNYQPNDPTQNSNNILIIIIAIVATALIVGGGVYVWQRSVLKNQEQNLQQPIIISEFQVDDLTREENTVNEEIEVSLNSMNSRQVYTDEDVGFSLTYPASLALTESNNNSLSLSVKSEKIDSLDYPMNYNQQTASNDQQELAQGNYGHGPDWPLAISRKVRNLGTVNGQELMVLARFEVCDITFERKLIFYQNNYQVVITLYGDKDNIINSNPQYFTTDQINCGNMKIWNFARQEQFYQDLEDKKLTGDAQFWFNLFDDIIDTIEIM